MSYSNRVAETRIAVYSQDGLGLGHMRRTNAIAWQIFQMKQNVSVLTLSDSPLGQFFPTFDNHDFIKLPSIVKTAPDNWKAAHLSLSFDKILSMRESLIRTALIDFAPHILLVDHMPHGAMGELIPALEALKKQHANTQVVLGLRDILDDANVIINRWQGEGAYNAIAEYYTRILVYGMRDVFDLASQYQFPDRISSLVHYCGYVCDSTPLTQIERIRASFLAGASHRAKLIVAQAGGGADAYPLMSTLLDTFQLIHKKKEFILALITGPFMPAELISDLKRRAAKLPVRIMESVAESQSYMAAADLVISMAGYNSSIEILHLKKPAILIPRAGPSAEQRMRARLFAARHWVEMIDPDDLTPQVLQQAILYQFMVPQIQPNIKPDLRGGMVAANHILSLANLENETEPVEMQPSGIYYQAPP